MGKHQVDFLQIAVIANVAAILVVLGTAIWIFLENSGSRNVGLALGALAGAMILFLTQLWFELQPSISRDHISTDFTIDRSIPSIRQWDYTTSPSWRIGGETQASSWLVKNNPTAFDQDREKLTLDFALYSLVSFFGRNEFDWQLKKVVYKGKASGTFFSSERISKPEECTAFKPEVLKALLSQAGNLFAGKEISISSGEWCLPPRSSVEIAANSLVIRNPICQLSFSLTLSGGITYTKPQTGGHAPQLKSGGPQYETRPVGLSVETLNFALRSQHRDSVKYRDWCARVVEGVREWFES